MSVFELVGLPDMSHAGALQQQESASEQGDQTCYEHLESGGCLVALKSGPHIAFCNVYCSLFWST